MKNAPKSLFKKIIIGIVICISNMSNISTNCKVTENVQLHMDGMD